MSQEKLSELVIPKVMEHYGENPPQEVSQRIAGELALIEANGWETDLLRAYEIAQRLCAAAELWLLPGIDGGFSLSAFLLGITQVNPLPPHYYCPQCKCVEFNSVAEDGFDLPDHTCPYCGTIMRGDGHEINLDDCAAYFAYRRKRYDLFSEWHVSAGGKHLIGEYFSQCGPTTPFFWIEFDEDSDYSDPNWKASGRRAVAGWVLSPPEALPVTDWGSVEYPKNSGQFVQAFFRKDELADLPYSYGVHESSNAELLTRLCRETGIKPESIPCNETHDFSRAVQEESARFYRPDGPNIKSHSINNIIWDRRLDWFLKNYPAEYSKLESSV